MWHSRMFWQLYGAFCLLVLISIGLLGFAVVRRVENHEYEQIQQNLRAKALMVEHIIRRRTVDSRVRRELHKLSRRVGIRITLIDSGGIVSADTSEDPTQMDNHADRPEVRKARSADDGFGAATRFSNTVNKTMMYVAVRTDSENNVAFVRAAIPITHVEELLADVHNLVWTAAGLIAVVFLGIAFLLARRISKPLQVLNQGAQQIASGAFGHKVYVDGKDEIGQLANSFNHMSERLAEQFYQLDDDRQKLNAVLGSMAEGVVAIDRDQRVLFANARAGQLLGFNTSKPVGRRFWELAPHRNLQDLIDKALDAGEFHRQELDWTRGERRNLAVQLGPLPGEPPIGVVLVFSDITDLRRLERLRQEFVANVSHELKTPLSIIKACQETLSYDATDEGGMRTGFLTQIGEQTDRLQHLIQDLLSLARIENELEAYVFQAISVQQIIDVCISRHRTIADAKNQTLQRIDPPVLSKTHTAAWVDEEAFTQIIENLVDNAVKYTPENGVVSVEWGSENDQIFVKVHDDGIGIPEADLPRIFERFYRADKARSRELGGTGLGLSIVKHLVAAMRGRVQASSKIGVGTTFTVYLPASVS